MGIVVVLALLSSVFYGASDFFGALTARRVTVLRASAAIYLAATVVVAVALAVVPWTFSDRAFWAGSVAGLLAVVGMVTFYAALALGPISLLAPLIALIQTAVPVIVAAVTGQSLGLVAWIAVVLALAATTLISVPPRADPEGVAIERINARGAVLALVSGVTLGFALVSLDLAPADSGLLPAFLDVAVGLVVLLPLLAVRRLRDGDEWLGDASAVRPEVAPTTGSRTWAMAAITGALLAVGNILLVVALQSGNLAVVAVLVSLYPLATVVLAWAVLKERVSPLQFAGVALAIVAAVMLGLS